MSTDAGGTRGPCRLWGITLEKLCIIAASRSLSAFIEKVAFDADERHPLLSITHVLILWANAAKFLLYAFN